MIYCSFYLDQHATWCKIIVVLVSSPPPLSLQTPFQVLVLVVK
jgi:hypothetical protein